jgi:hypothetical protein
MGPPARRVAHLPHRPRSLRAAAALFILGAAACLASPAVPRLAPPVVVDIHAAPPAAAFPLQPPPTSRRAGAIVIAPASPLRPTMAPAVVLDGRLWCPRRTATGGSTLHPGLPEVSPAEVVRVERLAGAEARRYATRCGPPTDGVVRIVTRSPPPR